MDLIVVRTAWVIFDDAERIFIIIVVVVVRMFGSDGFKLFGVSFNAVVVGADAVVLLLCDVSGGGKMATFVTESSLGTDVVVVVITARRLFELSTVDLWFRDRNFGEW